MAAGTDMVMPDWLTKVLFTFCCGPFGQWVMPAPLFLWPGASPVGIPHFLWATFVNPAFGPVLATSSTGLPSWLTASLATDAAAAKAKAGGPASAKASVGEPASSSGTRPTPEQQSKHQKITGWKAKLAWLLVCWEDWDWINCDRTTPRCFQPMVPVIHPPGRTSADGLANWYSTEASLRAMMDEHIQRKKAHWCQTGTLSECKKGVPHQTQQP